MLRSFFACLAVFAALFVVPATAAAQCSGGAVGDQYCDPLGGHKASAGGGNSSGGGSGGGGGGAGGSASAAAAGGSGSGGKAGSNMSEAAAGRVDPKTGLPATGVPVGTILGFGVALLASGLALRRLAGDEIS